MSRSLLELASTRGGEVGSYILSRLWRFLQVTVYVVVIYTHCIVSVLQSYTSRFIGKTRVQNRLMAAKIEKKETLVESIERKTGHWVVMETSFTNENLAKCNPQSNSPLFKLPKELRDMIFEYASSQVEDPKRPYLETFYYYRPGHTAKLKTYTSLLFTCRRAWLEANAMPMKLAEHAFWFQRGPYSQSASWAANIRHEHARYAHFLQRLTTSNLQNLTYIHLFTQMFQAQEFGSPHQMELFFWDHYLKLGLRPKIFHITIRQSDWWEWESDHALTLDEHWVQSILDAPRLGGTETFKLELETLASKKDQLDPIVERLQKLEGNITPVDPTDEDNLRQNRFIFASPLKTWQWTRSSNLDDRHWPVFKDLKMLELHVVTLSWRKQLCNTLRPQDGVQGSASRTPARPSAFPLPFRTNPIHTPATIMKMRARRALINELRWDQTNSFAQYAVAVQALANEQATTFESLSKDRFEKMYGDMEAKRMLQQWQANGSLLKFIERPD